MRGLATKITDVKIKTTKFKSQRFAQDTRQTWWNNNPYILATLQGHTTKNVSYIITLNSFLLLNENRSQAGMQAGFLR